MESKAASLSIKGHRIVNKWEDSESKLDTCQPRYEVETRKGAMRYLIERLTPHEPTDNSYNRMEKFLEHVIASASLHDTKDTYPEANDNGVDPKQSLHQHNARTKESNDFNVRKRLVLIQACTQDRKTLVEHGA